MLIKKKLKKEKKGKKEAYSYFLSFFEVVLKTHLFWEVLHL